MTWTPPRTWSAGENPRSMNLNTFIRDNTTYLKAKTLVQFHANSWDEVPGSSPDYQEGGTGNVIRWWGLRRGYRRSAGQSVDGQ